MMFGNEADRPYQVERVDVASTASMAYSIGRLRDEIRVPFGVDVLWDPFAIIALAKAVGAVFAREVFTNVYGSDMGFWDTSPGDLFRYKRLLEAKDLLSLHNVKAEFAAPIAPRPVEEVAKSTVISCLGRVICVSGPVAGQETRTEDLERVKEVVGDDVAVFANTGVRVDNVGLILEKADGVVADVAVVSRTLSDLEKVADEIRAQRRKALAVVCDVSVLKEVEQMVEKVINEFGRIKVDPKIRTIC